MERKETPGSEEGGRQQPQQSGAAAPGAAPPADERAAAGECCDPGVCGGEALPTELCCEHGTPPCEWTPASDPALPDRVCCEGIGYQTNTE
ncbi:hypothetical protein Rsub_01483 [Raphidocelis subcapitata]|uniref:Uncharacterized protein n=1 Tax=Raphidocelis subcapitata TaxID=307507 RepID=A0A2V0NN69_9CHLO|nr:hypothetical protein Rsub_01483 [Raphidocelis subcapitata]|eukprot:GBF88984.1 hypothetical protein Rsub_01483 [Raphidocelis subcapitata]